VKRRCLAAERCVPPFQGLGGFFLVAYPGLKPRAIQIPPFQGEDLDKTVPTTVATAPTTVAMAQTMVAMAQTSVATARTLVAVAPTTVAAAPTMVAMAQTAVATAQTTVVTAPTTVAMTQTVVAMTQTVVAMAPTAVATTPTTVATAQTTVVSKETLGHHRNAAPPGATGISPGRKAREPRNPNPPSPAGAAGNHTAPPISCRPCGARGSFTCRNPGLTARANAGRPWRGWSSGRPMPLATTIPVFQTSDHWAGTAFVETGS
jgi:hypothetical protein